VDDNNPTVGTLFLRYEQRLALRWIDGRQGEQHYLRYSDQTPGSSLVGYLNIIHPNRLQILGHLEFSYLNNLTGEMRRDLIAQLFSHQPAAVIVAEDLPAPDDLHAAAAAARTPLLVSGLSCVKLISSLRHYLESELTEKTTLQGVFLEVQGMGVLLTGESNMGKSELALELITRSHRLIADDAPEFSRVDPDTVRGTCPEILRDFLEVRGLGLLNIRAMYGDSAVKFSKDLRLVVRLVRPNSTDKQQTDRLRGSYRQRTILDVELPEVTLPVASGRNLAVLVEAAVRNHILLRKGYNASEAFIQRQRTFIQRQPNHTESGIET
jgi:HPr kinase/phosphorylase